MGAASRKTNHGSRGSGQSHRKSARSPDLQGAKRGRRLHSSAQRAGQLCFYNETSIKTLVTDAHLRFLVGKHFDVLESGRGDSDPYSTGDSI